MKRILIAFILLFASLISTIDHSEAKTIQGKGKLPETKYRIYIPNSIGMSSKYPALLGFSPSGNVDRIVSAFRQGCDRNRWILIACGNSRNGTSISGSEKFVLDTLNSAIKTSPIDKRMIFAGGFSGGGQVAYWYAQKHPELIKGVISNCGIIHRKIARNDYPRNRCAVLVASPTGFRYKDMRDDERFLRKLNWKVRWTEFRGGHTWAPQNVLSTAMSDLYRIAPRY